MEPLGVGYAFLALPHGVASEFATSLLAGGIKVLDLSADFRVKDLDTYKFFYKHDHPAPDLLKKSRSWWRAPGVIRRASLFPWCRFSVRK
jgi:N-acetyl-gamma-glutamyl-phosphate reductase